MLTDDQRSVIAERLWRAERDRAPIPPPVTDQPAMDVVDAYEIQLLNIRRRTTAPDGPEIVGHKVGLSSKAMQAMMGVDEPDYGHLLTDMALDQAIPIDATRYCYPRVEVEVGYLLGADLPAQGCTEADVLAGTAALVPAIELIDSRIVDWRIGLVDTIADNASSAGFLLGAERIPPAQIDVTRIEATLWRDGERVAEGRADAVLGDPTTAVCWLANTVGRFGVRLRAGHIVLPGSCTRAIDVRPGTQFRAEFTGLGSVTASFTAATAARHGTGDRTENATGATGVPARDGRMS